MNILFCQPTVGTIIGGTESYVYNFAKELSKKHNVYVLTGSWFGKELKDELGQIKVKVIPFFPRGTLLNNLLASLPKMGKFRAESISFYAFSRTMPWVLRELIKNKKIDIVSLHHDDDSLLWSRLFHRYNIPSISLLPGISIPNFFKYDKNTFLLTDGPVSKKNIENRFGVEVDGIITPGVPSRIFHCRNLQKKERKWQLIYVGRLGKGKGLFDLLEIYSRLRSKHEDLKLKIVGEGPLMSRLKNEAEERSLFGGVSFTGQVSNDKVFEYMRQSQLLVHPSKLEAFSVTILESLSTGTPIIASNIPGISAVTKENAVLLERGNWGLWVEEIDNLLRNEKRWQKLSKGGRKRAEPFTWERKATEYEYYLEQAVKKK